ncbi:extracellular solute-binding protein [Clostridium gasigenes]|uniref:extracellular solute-binding protein n=1 Tax=Clostridium gasigenes TaxID=94869 RepID=UPI0014386AA6|nr:extracellular solute-binding protein [Clostridium gasigenes]NKF08562.1 extracellular solute-binding protein [Clostridium gasigenes]
MKKVFKSTAVTLLLITIITILQACASKEPDKVVIYTNSDEEAIEVIQNTLNKNGYENQYILQSFGTSELGGKLMTEGSEIEADLVTMSSYFIESAQEKHNMFEDITFETNSLKKYQSYYAPILAITGALFINTEVIKEKSLPIPTSIKDLTKIEYKNLVSIPNILDSSTGWLLTQAIISEYGMEEGGIVLKGLIENCGPHIESSGSAPIKKVRSGEVAIGFGLRHQAINDKLEGKPIDYIDPNEGNFSLTESIAVVKKDDNKTKIAMEMAEVIIKEARKDLIKNYPVILYEGEDISQEYKAINSKEFKEPLKVKLLEEHQEFFKKARLALNK